MTCLGTCVPAGPSRNAAGCPFTCNFSDGNCARTQVESSGLLPVSCKAGVLIFVSRYGAKLSGQLVSHSQAAPLKCRGHDKITLVLFLTHAALAPAINSALRFSRGASCQKALPQRSARVWFESRIAAPMTARPFTKF